MLILSRKNGESVIIDGGIRVTVTGVKGRTVRLGIEAPAEIPIRRSELCDKRPGSVPELAASHLEVQVIVGEQP